MRDVIIWKIVGSVSAMNGLVCFGLSSTYNMCFGKLGYGGLVAYVMVSLIMWYLIIWGKRIRVSQKFQGVVVALMFVVICSITVVHDKLVTGKSDVLSIISYGSLALMSVSMSRKFELGFETGFSTFFLQLFASQLFKINWILLPIALVVCSLIILLRHCSESRVQLGSITPNGYHYLLELGPPNAAVIEIGDEESQASPGMEEISGQSLLSTNQEESSQATHHSPSNYGQVSEESISDWDNQEEYRWSFPAESSEQDQVSSGNNRVTIQNGWMQSFAEHELISSAPQRELPSRRRRRRMTPAILNLSSSLGDSLGRWGRQVAPLSFPRVFFF